MPVFPYRRRAKQAVQAPMNKSKRGAGFKPIPKIDATPEELARRIFAAAKPPDPSLRKPRKLGDRKAKP